MVILTDRDRYFLEILRENGMITYKQAGQLYETSSYHFKRLKQLIEGGYIKKNGRKYVTLGTTGVKELELNIKTNYKFQKRILEKPETEKREVSVDLMLLCSKYNCRWFYSRMAKLQFNISKNISINGLISCQNKNYPVYILSKYPLKTKIRQMQKEIPWLKIFDGIIVLCLTQEIYDAFNISINNNRAPAHLYLLEYPANIDLALSILNSEIMDNIYKTILKIDELLPTSKVYADKMVRRNNKEYYLTNLLINDLARLNYIKEYIDKWYKLEQRPIIVIHRENQNFFLSGEGVKTLAISDNQLGEIIQYKQTNI